LILRANYVDARVKHVRILAKDDGIRVRRR